MTYLEKIFNICDTEKWTAMWFRLGCVIVGTTDRAWELKEPQFHDLLPDGITRLGCSGLSLSGEYEWVGFDFDCSHGKKLSPEDALAEARKLKKALKDHAEIRRSRSGSGIHVRHLFDFHNSDAPAFAKALCQSLNLRADPAVCGRQAMWLWDANAGPGAFELLESHNLDGYHPLTLQNTDPLRTPDRVGSTPDIPLIGKPTKPAAKRATPIHVFVGKPTEHPTHQPLFPF